MEATMPVSAAELTRFGMSSIDLFTRNEVTDQIKTQRPFLAKMMEKQKEIPGMKQYIEERIKTSYGSNFQWYYGDDAVTYNNRDNLSKAQFPYRGCHDGYSIHEDELVSNGITLTDDTEGGQATEAERIQIVNIFESHNEDLEEGMYEKFNLELLRDGTSSTDAIAGLDSLVKIDPTTGTVGGIDQAANPIWRNHIDISSVTTANINDKLEQMWRACTRNGGRPDYISMGSDALDVYREANKSNISVNIGNGAQHRVEGGTSGLYFKGVPITWDPTFQDLDALDSPVVEWEKRIYMLQSKHIKLKPISGHNWVARKPPRVYDKYVHYFGKTWKGALTANRLNAHGILSLS